MDNRLDILIIENRIEPDNRESLLLKRLSKSWQCELAVYRFAYCIPFETA